MGERAPDCLLPGHSLRGALPRAVQPSQLASTALLLLCGRAPLLCDRVHMCCVTLHDVGAQRREGDCDVRTPAPRSLRRQRRLTAAPATLSLLLWCRMLEQTSPAFEHKLGIDFGEVYKASSVAK